MLVDVVVDGINQPVMSALSPSMISVLAFYSVIVMKLVFATFLVFTANGKISILPLAINNMRLMMMARKQTMAITRPLTRLDDYLLRC